MNPSRRWRGICLISLILTGCAGSVAESPTLAPEQLAETLVAQTMAVESPTVAPTFTATQPSSPTSPPPTVTSIPSATPTSGPIKLSDDFSKDTGYWTECPMCNWVNGTLVVGPYPPSNRGDAYFAICESCGFSSEYRMAVEATFHEGQSDRGFGFLISKSLTEIITFEIATWQYAGLFKFEPATGLWSLLYGWEYRSYIKPGTQTNHIEVIVKDSTRPGKSDITLMINGKIFLVYSGEKVDPTPVGLEVGWHSIGVAFDNFEFESFNPPETSIFEREEVYLSELTPSQAVIGFGEYSVGNYSFAWADDNIHVGDPIESRRTHYKYGIYAHAPSSITFPLFTEFSELTMTLTLIDNIACGDGVIFIVKFDGVEAYRSPTLLPESDPLEINLDLSGVQTIELITDQGSINNHCDWAIWGDPLLRK